MTKIILAAAIIFASTPTNAFEFIKKDANGNYCATWKCDGKPVRATHKPRITRNGDASVLRGTSKAWVEPVR